MSHGAIRYIMHSTPLPRAPTLCQAGRQALGDVEINMTSPRDDQKSRITWEAHSQTDCLSVLWEGQQSREVRVRQRRGQGAHCVARG